MCQALPTTGHRHGCFPNYVDFQRAEHRNMYHSYLIAADFKQYPNITFYVICRFLTSSNPLIIMWAHCMSVLLEVCCLAGMTPSLVAYHISTSSLMPQYHTTSDPETVLLLPLTAISPKHGFHWQDKPAMYFYST